MVRIADAHAMFNHGADLRTVRVEAAAILASLLGSDHYIVTKLDALRVPRGLTGIGLSMHEVEVTDDFIGLVRAGIKLAEEDWNEVVAPAPPDLCDPELWEHIDGLVQAEDWGLVPSAVATYAEDWFRKRADNPPNRAGGKLVGKDLFAHVLGESSPLRLGSQSSEHQGWMNLGIGLMNAVGNVHRHTIGQRTDAEEFAWRVIGLASLLLGEMKATHPRS